MAVNRRVVLEYTVQAGGLVVVGSVLVPALISGLSPALQPRRGELWQTVGPLADFPVGSVSPVEVDLPRDDWAKSPARKGIFVWRVSDDEVVVFSRSCTDVGCPITWDPASECFFCPCHGGIFDKSGERMAGPPPRPLYRYASRLRDGLIEVDLRSLPPIV